MDYKEIYAILRRKYGSIQFIADTVGVCRNTVTNVLLEKTKNGADADEIKKIAEERAVLLLIEERERIQKILDERQKLNEAAAILATN
jgi:hypothetical protein